MISAFVLPLLLALQSRAPNQDPSPYTIYRDAMARLATLPDPKYIVITEHWVTTLTGGEQSPQSDWNERVVLNSATRMENVLNIPFRPEAFPEIGESQFGPDAWVIDHIGARSRQRQQQVAAFQPDLSDLRTVASVVAVAKPSYDIRLAGIDQLPHGGSAYHLVLHPLSNSRLHNLRELWVNTQTSAIARAVIESDYRPNFYTSMPDDTYVTEDFGQVGPYWLVTHWSWSYRAPFSRTTYHYDATSLSMRFPDTLPDWFFDRKQFWKHAGEVNAYVGCDATSQFPLEARFKLGVEPCPASTSPAPSFPAHRSTPACRCDNAPA